MKQSENPRSPDSSLRSPSVQSHFEDVYRRNRWKHGSGGGSLPSNTTEYRSLLQQLLTTLRPAHVLDLGCGDWQFSKLVDWGDATYLGIDVVPDVVASNNKLFSNPKTSFLWGDLLSCDLPRADLVVVKDVLQHLQQEQIDKILSRISELTPNHVLITNSIVSYKGSAKPFVDIVVAGEFRSLDVRLPPFNLVCKELLTYDARSSEDDLPDTKSVLLWSPMEHPYAN